MSKKEVRKLMNKQNFDNLMVKTQIYDNNGRGKKQKIPIKSKIHISLLLNSVESSDIPLNKKIEIGNQRPKSGWYVV